MSDEPEQREKQPPEAEADAEESGPAREAGQALRRHLSGIVEAVRARIRVVEAASAEAGNVIPFGRGGR